MMFTLYLVRGSQDTFLEDLRLNFLKMTAQHVNIFLQPATRNKQDVPEKHHALAGSLGQGHMVINDVISKCLIQGLCMSNVKTSLYRSKVKTRLKFADSTES